MADLYLVRHGQTELNVQNILQGWQDSPLTERGREQALATRTAFAARGVAFDHLYSSPLGRARRTAELIVGEGRSIALVDDLREWHLGSLEGTSNRKMPAQPWGDYPVAFGGESETQLRARMVAALSRIMARSQHNCVLAVSHGSACQEFLRCVTGGGEQPDNGAVLHFGYRDGAFSLLDW
ncbi:MAG: histidine phosphatase family protein [Collinsella sp.]|uniref:histidine phosphatase family protein n=1 Tax=Collinsella sp. CLA-JM-H32B TaxID=3136221 RepID=UPI0032C0057F